MTAPYAPLLGSPAHLAYLDANAGFTASWTFRPGAVGDVQGWWALRRRVAGSSTFEWWNNTTALWSLTIIWNSGAAASKVFPAAKWPNSTIYQWTVATKNGAGDIGTYADERLLVASNAPVLTLTGPSSPVLSSRPSVTYTYTDADGHAMETLRLLVFTHAVWSAGGFDPDDDAALALWDSGVMLRTLDDESTYPVGVDLPDENDVRVYGIAQQTGDQQSAWAYVEFDVTLTTPSVPTIIVVTDEEAGDVEISVAASLNLLTAGEADFETASDELLWQQEPFGTLERSTDWAQNGTYSLKVTAWSTFDILYAYHLGLGDTFTTAQAAYTDFDDFRTTLV